MYTCHYTLAQTHRMYNNKMNSRVNYEFFVVMKYCKCSSVVTNVLLWWDILIIGKVMHFRREKVYGKSP